MQTLRPTSAVCHTAFCCPAIYRQRIRVHSQATVLPSPCQYGRLSKGLERTTSRALPFSADAWQSLAVQTRGWSRTYAVSGQNSGLPQQGLQFQLLRITGDGACMFRACAQGAHHALKGTTLTPEAEAKAAYELRIAVVKELQKRREEIEPFLPGITDDFDEYLRIMANPAAWGGEPEMMMASHVLRRPITVYRPVGGAVEPIVTYNEELLAQGQTPISLLWSGAHYDALLLAAPDT